MFFIDVQGTLIDDGKKPIDGAVEFIEKLNLDNIPYVVVTNNTKQESDRFLEYLNSIGFQIPKHRYLDPLMILDEVVSEKSCLAFGTTQFLSLLENRGYEIHSKSPKYILLGVKHDYTAEEFSNIIETLLSNPDTQLIGMHGTSTYMKHGKRYPGVGAILEMLKFATGRDYQVVGKPSDIFYQKALEKIGADSFREITMVSDDFKGDLQGAKELGMKIVLVLSGKIKSIDEVVERPDIYIPKLSTKLFQYNIEIDNRRRENG